MIRNFMGDPRDPLRIVLIFTPLQVRKGLMDLGLNKKYVANPQPPSSAAVGPRGRGYNGAEKIDNQF